MSQTAKTQLRLRQLILSGELPPGERLVEVALVAKLGVSRTPIRAALVKLEEEGLLEALSNGGYIVRSFTEHDIKDAIEVRGALEGTAVRLIAERGLTHMGAHALKNCLREIDELIDETEQRQDDLRSEDFDRYFELNAQFHDMLVSLSESFVIRRMLDRIATLPFASPNAFVFAQSELGRAWKILFLAQQTHKSIFEAIEQGEGARAEALAREHARHALQNLRTVLDNQKARDHLPGAALIEFPGRGKQNKA